MEWKDSFLTEPWGFFLLTDLLAKYPAATSSINVSGPFQPPPLGKGPQIQN